MSPPEHGLVPLLALAHSYSSTPRLKRRVPIALHLRRTRLATAGYGRGAGVKSIIPTAANITAGSIIGARSRRRTCDAAQAAWLHREPASASASTISPAALAVATVAHLVWAAVVLRRECQLHPDSGLPTLRPIARAAAAARRPRSDRHEELGVVYKVK
eukprot:2189241-Prymnesium_polylepis.2